MAAGARRFGIGLAVAAWLAALSAAAAEPPPAPPQARVGSRLITAHTPHTLGARVLQATVDFRMSETVEDGSERDLWGIDSGADVGLGLAVGVASRLDLELYRSSFHETYEPALKLALWRPRDRPLTAALRAGADLVRRQGVADRDRPFGQLLLGLRLARGVHLFLAPACVRHTPRLRDACNVPFGFTLPFAGGALIKVEGLPANRDLEESQAQWQVALSKATPTHVLELVLANSRATTMDQYLGGDFAGGFARDDVRVGVHVVTLFDSSR
ncbi:MAG TPA: DUF5777 family beta-barrel protein [Thermoanaerobaculia bacterium]|nr:DUF5777 family beta-barrel protein [Thermoanaerobaculia bacterium]